MTVKTEDAAREGRPAARTSRGGSGAGGEQLSRADRAARGKDARAVAPLESHSEFTPDASRDPVGLLLEQAKSGDRIALAAYLGDSGKFDQAIAGFAEKYADQNEHDYAALQAAVKDGRAQATTDI